MLTSEDLQKISELFDTKMDQRFDSFEKKLHKSELNQNEKIEERFNTFSSKFDEILDKKFKEEMAPIKKDSRIIKADLRTTIKFFDDDVSGLKKRIDRIEEYIGINN